MGEREERLARNEALFRDLNERMKEIAHSLTPGEPMPVLEIFCECGQAGCVEKLVVPIEEYEAVRAHPERFLVARGHEFVEVENVVGQANGYSIVEKHEVEAAIARQTDPRS
jgi:hypothetical protein